MSKLFRDRSYLMNRRAFLSKSSTGIGIAALSSLLGLELMKNSSTIGAASGEAIPDQIRHIAPKAKRVIYLFQSGGPSQLELFDYKPLLQKRRGENLPTSIRNGQKLSENTLKQKKLPLVNSPYSFKQYGKSGAWVSELLPYTSQIVDELCIIKSMHTNSVDHDPAITFFQTGSERPGLPSMGAWMSYGLGSINQELPTFTVLLSKGTGAINAQPLKSRLWGNGFLHSSHQGVQFRSSKDPVLYLNNPNGMDPKSRRRFIDQIAKLNDIQYKEFGVPEVNSRVDQYEMAYKMQTSIPELMDVSKEPDYIYKMYGPEAAIPGTYAANCLLARKLAEKDVRFVQLYHMGWDQHDHLPRQIKRQALDTDQASAALVRDLKQRGMLKDTLVIWGGEFGRTNFSEGVLTKTNFGRDHHPRCFTIWMAGGGIKPGITYGATDDLGYNIIKDPIHVHDFQATLLHLLGIEHERLTFKHQGRRFRLTDVHGEVKHKLII